MKVLLVIDVGVGLMVAWFAAPPAAHPVMQSVETMVGRSKPRPERQPRLPASRLPIAPTDSHHLEAAQGWLELGNYLEANTELERITPQLRAHPHVLALRWEIYGEARRWDAALANVTPDEAGGLLSRGETGR